MPSSKKAFITGVAGFVGKYLAAHLNEQGYTVYGTDRWPACGCPDVDYHEGDILDTAALAQLFLSIRPDMIFHLAGVSFPGDAKKELFAVLWEYFAPHRAKRDALVKNPGLVDEIRKKGAARARAIGLKTLDRVRELVGVK